MRKVHKGQVHVRQSCIFVCYSNQSFLLKLSDDAARTLPPDCQEPLSSVDVPKLTIAVYPRHVAEDMAAHVSLLLRELKLTVSVNETMIVGHNNNIIISHT